MQLLSILHAPDANDMRGLLKQCTTAEVLAWLLEYTISVPYCGERASRILLQLICSLGSQHAPMSFDTDGRNSAQVKMLDVRDTCHDATYNCCASCTIQ
jgi:hypothetical protein